MPSLEEVLLEETTRAKVVRDCLDLIDEEVAEKRGISGIAIKAGYKAVKGIRPSFLKEAVEGLLPHFSKALDPIHQEAAEKGVQSSAHFEANGARVADALLSITDERAERSPRGLVKTTYGKLRPMAKKNVEAAVPRLGRMIDKYASANIQAPGQGQ